MNCEERLKFLQFKIPSLLKSESIHHIIACLTNDEKRRYGC